MKLELNILKSGNWRSVTQVTRVEGMGIVELYVCARPTHDKGGFSEQAHSMYDHLFDVLAQHGASPRNVITEKVFFSDVDRQFQDLEKIRKDCYNRMLHAAEYLPATIFLHQPPCHPGRLCELQVYAIFPEEENELTVRTIENAPGLASGKVVEFRGYRDVYLTNLTGGEGPGDGLDFSAQATDMFARAKALLHQEGISFPEVLRTWIYINNIERDYAAFNKVRTTFYQEHGVTRLPASTGIQGATYPRERGCTMDVYTLVSDRPIHIEVMHAPTMNEAAAYGSSFSRGMKVVREDRVMLYVSGTASIDDAGNVLHLGDIEGQVDRMLRNVEELLAPQGATLHDLVTAITYLKEPGFLDSFFEVCAKRSVPEDIPNTVSVVDICRPEWLCEIEGIAICPKNR